jgi:hypothetical protein
MDDDDDQAPDLIDDNDDNDDFDDDDDSEDEDDCDSYLENSSDGIQPICLLLYQKLSKQLSCCVMLSRFPEQQRPVSSICCFQTYVFLINNIDMK